MGEPSSSTQAAEAYNPSQGLFNKLKLVLADIMEGMFRDLDFKQHLEHLENTFFEKQESGDKVTPFLTEVKK